MRYPDRNFGPTEEKRKRLWFIFGCSHERVYDLISTEKISSGSSPNFQLVKSIHTRLLLHRTALIHWSSCHSPVLIARITVAITDEMTLELRLRLYQSVESHRTAVDSQRDRRSCGTCLERIETINIPHMIVFDLDGTQSIQFRGMTWNSVDVMICTRLIFAHQCSILRSFLVHRTMDS